MKKEPLPYIEGGFGCVVADPPWDYRAGKASRIAPRYATMDVDSICKIPVQSIVAERALCFIWTTSSFLAEGLRVLASWGFQYKASGVWVKAAPDLSVPPDAVAELYAAATTYADSPSKFAAELRRVVRDQARLKVQIGMGSYFRQAHELVLVGSRGGLTAEDRGVGSVIVAPRGEHSVKPDELLEAAERMAPGPHLEMFARRPRPGWVSWGNDPEVRDA